MQPAHAALFAFCEGRTTLFAKENAMNENEMTATRDEIVQAQREILCLVRDMWKQQAGLLGQLIDNLVHIQAEIDRITATLEPTLESKAVRPGEGEEA